MVIKESNSGENDKYITILTAEHATVEAYVDVTEMMGAETYLYLQIAGSTFTARVNARSTSKAEDTVKVGFDVNRLHFFDKDTELAIR